MRQQRFFALAFLVVLLSALLTAPAAFSGEKNTRVVLGKLKSVSPSGEVMEVVEKNFMSKNTLTFTIQKGASITFKGSPAEITLMPSGTEVLVTYAYKEGKLVCVALRRVR